MDKTFLFYDLETSGLSVCHDQPIQVAAVRVDSTLQIRSETEFKVRPRPDVVWSLGAMKITGLLPSMTAGGESEYHAALKLHRMFTEPGTTSIGFNSFSFDDRVARFLFYRNLCDPYQHQYANGCGRADVLAMVVYFVLFAEDVFEIPRRADSSPTFALSALAEANRIPSEGAHDALADVKMTIGIFARMVAARPAIVEWLLKRFQKAEDKKATNLLPAIPIQKDTARWGVMINHRAHAAGYRIPVVRMDVSDEGSETWLALDTDLGQYLRGDADARPRLYFRRPGEPPLVIPADRAKLGKESLGLVNKNLETLKQTGFGPFREDTPKPVIDPGQVDLDARLYQGRYFDEFRSAAPDINRFHAELTAETKYAAALAIREDRFRELAIRVMYRNYHDHPAVCRPAAEFNRLRREGKAGGLDFQGVHRRTLSELEAELLAALSVDAPENNEFFQQAAADFGLYLESPYPRLWPDSPEDGAGPEASVTGQSG